MQLIWEFFVAPPITLPSSRAGCRALDPGSLRRFSGLSLDHLGTSWIHLTQNLLCVASANENMSFTTNLSYPSRPSLNQFDSSIVTNWFALTKFIRYEQPSSRDTFSTSTIRRTHRFSSTGISASQDRSRRLTNYSGTSERPHSR